ncbi:hypothetical protein ACLB2K_068407 [Fragaria x ananassa]
MLMHTDKLINSTDCQSKLQLVGQLQEPFLLTQDCQSRLRWPIRPACLSAVVRTEEASKLKEQILLMLCYLCSRSDYLHLLQQNGNSRAHNTNSLKISLIISSFVGTSISRAFLKVLLARLASHDFLNYAQQKGVAKKLEKWRKTVSDIDKHLRDAEEKQLMISKTMHKWLFELTHLAYDVEDILDKLSAQMLTGMYESGAGSSMVRSFIPKVKLYFDDSEMECIAHRLQKLATEQEELLQNVNLITESTSLVALQRSPSSIVIDTPVAGRDEEIETIVGLLSKDYEPSRTTNFHSVVIVGMPGVGKTTLVAHVFFSEAIEQFNPKVWVSVSHNFNLERVMRAICRKVTSRPCDQDDFSEVQDDLKRAIAGQKLLVVLDDVWSTCDYESWTILQSHFHVGAPGSKILITTREEKVARLIGATEVYNLKVLSDEECLQVFMQHINNHRPPDFDAVLANKIVGKCSGLPLAAKTLGGILRCKVADKWEDVLDDKLWSISNNESNIPSVLKLIYQSYHYLPSAIKRGFYSTARRK